MEVAANASLKVYASLIKGVTDASAVKDSKTNGQIDVKKNNQVATSAT